jgi:dephospho-CoA kinase
VTESNPSHIESAKIFVVGLTGGIGSGKSSVAKALAHLGAATVDADQVARDLTRAGGRAMPMIGAAFGGQFISPDGALDRAAMRASAFADPALKATLEGILHPLVRQQIAHKVICAANGGAPYIILEIPLLFEGMTYRQALSRTLCVDCPVSVQIARVKLRSKLPEAEIKAIIASQIPRAIRLQLADDVIENVDSEADLIANVASLHTHYMSLARLFP